MTRVNLVTVHTTEQVETIINDAYRIASEYTQEPRELIAVFEKACDLLAARVPLVEQGMPAPIDLGALRS